MIKSYNYYIRLFSFFFLIILYNVIHPNINNSTKYKIFNPYNNLLKFKKCYYPVDDSNIRIVHFIITRFLVDVKDNFGKYKIYSKDYILNGIRVMKQYLLPSLENQSCTNFIWLLMIGNNVKIDELKFYLTFNTSFEYKLIYQKEIKNYVRTFNNYSVLITTRIDYDDKIYYDAVNDVRKAININKPILLYGYNRGLYYFEYNNKYYDYYRKNNNGILAIFTSLIIILDKVNDILIIHDLGAHTKIKKNLLNKIKILKIKNINYDPIIVDSGDPKFIYVRQKYSNFYNGTLGVSTSLKSKLFNITSFIG